LTWWFFFCASIVGAIVLTNVIPAAVRAIRGLGGARQLLPGVAILAAFGAVFVFLLEEPQNEELRRRTSFGEHLQEEHEDGSKRGQYRYAGKQLARSAQSSDRADRCRNDVR